nr:MAG TPA: hypothetical protein [Bacteriophage sp.]
MGIKIQPAIKIACVAALLVVHYICDRTSHNKYIGVPRKDAY